MGKEVSYSLIKFSPAIRKCLKSRFGELKITLRQVVADARSRGVLLDSAALSKYIKGHRLNIPAEDKILWLCVRYNVAIKLVVGDKFIDEKGNEGYKLNPYNEVEALERLKKLFPNKSEIQ
jgi:hypothetical protein